MTTRKASVWEGHRFFLGFRISGTAGHPGISLNVKIP